MDTLVDVTEEHLESVLHPARHVGVMRFGNQVPTAHVHVLPREAETDGVLWEPGRPFVSDEEREATRELLAFGNIPNLKEEAHRRIGQTLLAFAKNYFFENGIAPAFLNVRTIAMAWPWPSP